MGYIGNFALEDTLTWLHQAVDGGGVPTVFTGTGTYRIYGDSGLMSGGTGNLAAFDAGNTTGLYQGTKALHASDGYERGATYTIRVIGTVSGSVRAKTYTFDIS